MFVFAGWICRHYQQSSHCLEYPKQSLLKTSHQKKYFKNFTTPKKFRSKERYYEVYKTILKNAQNV